MALELIKEYLVGIGFNVDLNSLNNAEQSIKSADRTIKNFNDNSKKGFSESFDSMKDLFSLFSSSSTVIGKLFPELQTPLKNLAGDISTVKKLFKDLGVMEVPEKNKEASNQKRKPQTKDNRKRKTESATHQNTSNNQKVTTDNQENKGLSVLPKNTELLDTSKNLIESILDAKDATKVLETQGGGALSKFSMGAVGSVLAITAAVSVAVLAIKGLSKFLSELAQQDIEYEKLSRQLWTTKENAKEVDMALKTMGATMQDLWLSPTLMKQFTQLRKDSAALKLPKEYTENLKVIQGITLEFKRLKQFGELAFQWIGNYILKYAAEPLAELKQFIHEINDWIVKNLPGIGKTIGSIIGLIVRVALEVGKVIGVLFKLTSPIFAIIKLFDKLPESVKNFGKVVMALASPFILILGLIDDIMTAFEGGKSVIGSIFGLSNDKKALSNIGSKVKEYGNNTRINTVPSSYATNNTSNSNVNTTSNSNNKVETKNTFNVYGGSDANSTANVVSNKVNGLHTRNMQGVFN